MKIYQIYKSDTRFSTMQHGPCSITSDGQNRVQKDFFMSVVSTETLIAGQTEQEHEKCDIYRLVHRGSVLNLFFAFKI